jgi:ABC-type sugar transport system ATPase subunit
VTALTLEALTKIFPRAGREVQARQDGLPTDATSLKVVDSIDLKIEDGEFFTLLGPSGCGKSTTLRMIAGFEEPTSGRILFDKTDVTFDPPNRRDIGFVFQNYALFPHLTVARNVAFGLQVRKLRQEEVRQRVKAALEEVQLGGFEEARVDRRAIGSPSCIVGAFIRSAFPRTFTNGLRRDSWRISLGAITCWTLRLSAFQIA